MFKNLPAMPCMSPGMASRPLLGILGGGRFLFAVRSLMAFILPVPVRVTLRGTRGIYGPA